MWAHTPILTPERKVWRAVLTQAFEDAEMARNEDEGCSVAFACTRAREYLRADNFEEAEHLKLVCDYAEIPADRVISWARRRYGAEGAIEGPVEYSGADGAFVGEGSAGAEEREICSRSSRNLAVEAVIPEAPEARGCFPTKHLELTTEN